jgi:hypothetical protein
MARTFSQKTNLDPLHFMDPEDLLELQAPPLPALPLHLDENRAALETLVTLNVSHRYTWLDWSERYGVDSDMERGARMWNEAMARAQKVRLESVVVAGDDAGPTMTEE